MTLSADGTTYESGIIWIFMVSSFALARPPPWGPAREWPVRRSEGHEFMPTCGRVDMPETKKPRRSKKVDEFSGDVELR
jgi:hypothetical protein